MDLINNDFLHDLLFDSPVTCSDVDDAGQLQTESEIESTFDGAYPDGHSHVACPTAGDPIADAQWWNEQTADDTCAVVAQQGILESLVGHEIPQDELVRIASDHGWYHPHEGTSMECVGNVLEYYGVPIERRDGCTLHDLYDALDNGQKVIVGVDADEIWTPQHDSDGEPLKIPGGANHALWVTGIGNNPNGELSVIVNDSGTPDGRSEFIPVDDFLNAWDDSNNYAVLTDTTKDRVIT
jgi:hypothetical protein